MYSFLLLSSLAILGGCSKNVDRSGVPGEYKATHADGIETLELHGDGTYTNRFRTLNGAETASSGKWGFEPYFGESKVEVYNFSSHFPNPFQTGASNSLLGIEKDWGHIRLYYSYDRDEYYSKTGN